MTGVPKKRSEQLRPALVHGRAAWLEQRHPAKKHLRIVEDNL
jgi:hypothetical protein